MHFDLTTKSQGTEKNAVLESTQWQKAAEIQIRTHDLHVDVPLESTLRGRNHEVGHVYYQRRT